MSLQSLFSLSSTLVMPFWLLMMVLPHWRWTKRLMQSPLVALPPALIYAALVFPQFGEIYGAVSSPTLSSIATLLGSPTGATIAWAHFLAFDLLVGRWAYLDSRERKISAFIVSPILFFTLMLGPIGFVSYLAVRELYTLLQRDNKTLAATKPVEV